MDRSLLRLRSLSAGRGPGRWGRSDAYTRPGACRVPRRDRDGYQHGGAPRGERCCIAVPHGHYKTTTVTAALRASGPFAVYLMDGATNGARFLSYVTDVLVPALTPDDTVVMDNLATHKVAGVRQAIEAVGAHLRYPPAYSPDFNPIEQTFAKLKALLRTAAARTVPDLWAAIQNAFNRFKPDECRAYLAAAGYDACDPA